MTQRPTEADVTVVIPTLGRAVLGQALEALERGTVWPSRVVVVDQGAQADIAMLLEAVKRRSFDTLWIPSSDPGRAAGVNRGVASATTRYVAVTDDDCLVDVDWLKHTVARLRRHPDAIVTGSVRAGGNGVLSVATSQEEALQRRPGFRFDRLSGGNMAVARSVFERLGGLDEDGCVRTAEDGEFAYRALRAGVAIVYAPEIAVTHLDWRDHDQRLAQYASYARSQGGFYGKYLRRGDLFIAARAGVHFARALRRWAVGTFRGDREIAMNGRAYVLGLLPGIRAGWRSGGAE